MDKNLYKGSWIWGFAIVAFTLINSTCQAGGCNQFFAVKSRAIVSPVYSNQFLYSVGQPLQAQAANAADPKYQAFKEGVLEGLKAAIAAGVAQQIQAQKQSLLEQKCGKCHGQEIATPKGETFILDTNNAATITAALRQISENKMPPDSKLTAEEKGALMQALLDSEANTE